MHAARRSAGCAFGACGLVALWESLERWARVVVAGSLGLMTAAHLFLFVFVHATFGSGATAFGLETREAFRLGPADEEGADRLVMARRALAVSTVDGPRSTVRVYALNSPES